jgi:nitroimidazol reductase NimA-like FMN-containing flavoprotein (pyridoxamine 5'-phosphate oxidase superfamily)
VDDDISLSQEELQSLIARETIAVVASIDPDGTPHAVPVWPILIGEDLYFETERVSRKARNLRERPACCVVFGLGTWAPSAVLFGRAAEIADEGVRAKVREITGIRYYGTTAHPSFRTIERQYVQFGGSSVFRVDVERTVSWSYQKLPTQEWILPDPPPTS